MECVECYITFTFMCIYDLITPLPKVMTMKCVVNEFFSYCLLDQCSKLLTKKKGKTISYIKSFNQFEKHIYKLT